MTKEKALEVLKKFTRTIAPTLAITVFVKVVDDLYDYRIILGILAGKFGYDKVQELINKIKVLQ